MPDPQVAAFPARRSRACTPATHRPTDGQAWERGLDVESRVLDLAHVPRAIVSRNTRLTIGESIHLAAQSFARDPAKLSCCAA